MQLLFWVNEENEIEKQCFKSPVMNPREMWKALLNQSFHQPIRMSVYVRRFLRMCKLKQRSMWACLTNYALLRVVKQAQMCIYVSFTAAIMRAMCVFQSSERQALINRKFELKMCLEFRTNRTIVPLLGVHGDAAGVLNGMGMQCDAGIGKESATGGSSRLKSTILTYVL